MSLKTYDPGLVIVTFKGIILGGFMSGTFVKAERSEDAYKLSAGSQGEVVRVRSRRRDGTVTVTLQGSSPTNDLLVAIAIADEAANSGVGALSVTDLNGGTLIASGAAWIRKLPDYEAGDDLSGREWVIDCDQLVMNLAGADF